MKALRIVLIVLGGALVLLVVAAVVLVRSFDPNAYKDEITAYVQERTGRTLTIDEDIELSLFPWFAVETGGVALSDDPAFGTRSFIAVESLSARVRVWPLLKRRVEIGRVVLDGINVNLGLDAGGRGNWTSLLEATTAAEAPEVPAEAPGRPRIEQLNVEGIELRDARVLWHAASGEVSYRVGDLYFRTGPIRDADPVEFALDFSLLDVASQASIVVSLESVAVPAPRPEIRDTEATIRVLDAGRRERAAGTLTARSLTLEGPLLRSGSVEIAASLTEPPRGPDSLALALRLGGIELDTASERLAVTGLTTRAAGVSATWTLDGMRVLSAPELSGTVVATASSIESVLDTLGVALPEALAGRSLGSVTGTAGFALTPGPTRLGIEPFELLALGTEARGRASLAADGGILAHIELPAVTGDAPLRQLIQSLMPSGTDLAAIRTASLSADISLPPETGRLGITGLLVGLDQAEIRGQLGVTGLAEVSRVEGSLSAAGLDNRQLRALFGAWLPEALLSAEVGEFDLATDFDYAPATRTARLDPVELQAWGLAGDGQITLTARDDAVTLSGQASLDRFSPRALLARFDLPVPQSSDPTALAAAELAASFETTGSSGRFRDIVVQLDDSRITGEFSVENFADPEYRFVLRADTIDVDRYLPPRAAADADAPTEERRLGDIALASEPLSATVVTGTASVGDLRLGGMRFEQLATDLAVGGGRAALNSVRTGLYGGEFSGGVSLDATGELPSVHLTGTARNLALGPLLEDMLGAAHLSGTGNFELDLTGQGNTIGEAMQTAAGTMNFSFANGMIDGINVGRTLCAAVNSARQLPPPAAAPDATAYTLIRASATVSDGIASTSDLLAQTNFLDMTGQGRMRLVDQWLDTSHVARLTGPVTIAGCERLNSQVDNSIPLGFTLRGILPDVDVRPDVGQFVQDWIRREVRNEVRDSIQERAGEALRRILE